MKEHNPSRKQIYKAFNIVINIRHINDLGLAIVSCIKVQFESDSNLWFTFKSIVELKITTVSFLVLDKNHTTLFLYLHSFSTRLQTN